MLADIRKFRPVMVKAAVPVEGAFAGTVCVCTRASNVNIILAVNCDESIRTGYKIGKFELALGATQDIEVDVVHAAEPHSVCNTCAD